jgi:hypothetical protein
VTIKIGNRLETAHVIGNESQTFYKVDFGDGTFSNDMLPEDILDHDGTPPKPGSLVRVKWDDDNTYSCTFLGSYQTYVYTLEVVNSNGVSRKPKLIKKSHKELSLLIKPNDLLNIQVQSPKSPVKRQRRPSYQPPVISEEQQATPPAPPPPLSQSTHSMRKRIKQASFSESRSDRHSNDENESKDCTISPEEMANDSIGNIPVVEVATVVIEGGSSKAGTVASSPLRRSSRLTPGIVFREVTSSGVRRLRDQQQQLLEINDNKQIS